MVSVSAVKPQPHSFSTYDELLKDKVFYRVKSVFRGEKDLGSILDGIAIDKIVDLEQEKILKAKQAIR